MPHYVLHAMIPVNLALPAWVLVGRAISESTARSIVGRILKP